MDKLLKAFGLENTLHPSVRLMNIMLLLVIFTTFSFLVIYVLMAPFLPAIIVHVFYLLLNLHLIFALRRGAIQYVKIILLTSFLIQLSMAVFLWFPITTNYNLYYLVVPLVAFSLVDYNSKIDLTITHIFSFISAILFLVSKTVTMDFFLYQTPQKAEMLISLMTIVSVIISMKLLFQQYAKDQYKYQKELERLANTDSLTNIHNRRVLYKDGVIEFDLARKFNHDLTLLIMDIDNFKMVNDQYGHPAGDQLLIKLTDIILRHIRKEDTFFRYGGEEFAILIRKSSLEDSKVLATKLLKVVENESFEIEGNTLKVTLSFGLAMYSDEYKDFDGMMSAADNALYTAKKQGKNRVEVV